MTGKELKELRESAGLTQTQLAKMCGLSSKNVICNYESDDKKGSRNITKPMEILFKMIIESNAKREHYDYSKTLESNLIYKIRWGTDDELDDLAFWVNKWKLKF